MTIPFETRLRDQDAELRANVRLELDGLRADRLIIEAIMRWRLDRFEKENDALRRQVVELTQDRDSWKRQWGTWDNAWTRALGGEERLAPKRHKIDALVMTTERLRERSDKLSRVEIEMNLATWIAEYGPFRR